MIDLIKNKTVEEDFKELFTKYGGFHDSGLKKISVNYIASTMILYLHDPLINFKGLEGYVFIDCIQIIFEYNTIDVYIQNSMNEDLYIYEIVANDKNIEISIVPNGNIKLNVNKVKIHSIES